MGALRVWSHIIKKVEDVVEMGLLLIAGYTFQEVTLEKLISTVEKQAQYVELSQQNHLLLLLFSSWIMLIKIHLVSNRKTRKKLLWIRLWLLNDIACRQLAEEKFCSSILGKYVHPLIVVRQISFFSLLYFIKHKTHSHWIML